MASLISLLGMAVLIAVAALSIPACGQGAIEDNLAKINLPDGFEIAIYAEVPGAREMAVGLPLGVVFVGSRPRSRTRPGRR